MPAILVMGATGGLGGQVVEFLLRRVCAENIVALACDPAKLQSFAERGVKTVDYSDTDSLERTISRVEKLLLVSARAFTDAAAQHANVIEAAKRAGVRHLHYTAIQQSEGGKFEIPRFRALCRALVSERAVARP